MTNVNHHLTEPLLLAYSAGTLPEAFNLVIATHLAMSDEARAMAESYDAVGGAILSDTDVVEMEADALEATLRLIDAPEDTHIKAQVTEDDLFPAPLRDYVGGGVEAVSWKNVGGGVRQAILPTAKGASARLLYIPKGCAMPDHGHRGTELTLVLQGAYRDEHDRFARGDIEVACEDMEHTPVVEGDEDCICLAATDAPLKFRGLIPRLAQPFLRI